MSTPTPADGRITFALRVGVTGHRHVRSDPALATAIRDALASLRGIVGHGDAPLLVVVSALAEGADRLVACEVLADDRNRLEVALPLSPEDYATDFASEASKQEFRELLGRATHVWQAPATATREEAYERAGRHVVEQADAVIALWDGAPSRGRGGTADIVAFVRRQRVPLVVINPTTSPAQITPDLATPYAEVLREAAATLHRYNAVHTTPERLARHSEQEKRYLSGPRQRADGGGASPAAVIADQVLPYFVRADVQALAFQLRFQWLSAALFFIAAAAVSLVAIQVNVLYKQYWPIAIELALLLALVAMPLLGRRSRLHERWISYRFLAERLRSAYFLALVGTSDRRDRSQPRGLADSKDLWLKRALEEVTSALQRPPVESAELPELRAYLSTYWIEAQIAYHAKAGRQHRRRDDQLLAFTAFLFGISFVAALAHLFGIVGWVPEDVALQEEMREAGSIEVVRRIAADTERVMREENADWFGVMRFFDVELIT